MGILILIFFEKDVVIFVSLGINSEYEGMTKTSSKVNPFCNIFLFSIINRKAKLLNKIFLKDVSKKYYLITLTGPVLLIRLPTPFMYFKM